MRTIFCVLATLMLGLTSLQAQSLKAIKLNAPRQDPRRFGDGSPGKSSLRA